MNSIKQIEIIYGNCLVGSLALTKEGLCALSIQQNGSIWASPCLRLNYLVGHVQHEGHSSRNI